MVAGRFQQFPVRRRYLVELEAARHCSISTTQSISKPTAHLLIFPNLNLCYPPSLHVRCIERDTTIPFLLLVSNQHYSFTTPI